MNKNELLLRQKELAKLISQKYDEISELRIEQEAISRDLASKYSLKEACQAIQDDVNNSPEWLLNIYKQNREIRKLNEHL